MDKFALRILPVIVIAAMTGTMSAATAAAGDGTPKPAPAVAALDEATLKKNMHSRIVQTIKDQGLPITPAFQAFTPEQIIVTKKIPFSVGDRDMYLVSMTFKAPPQLGGNREAAGEDQTLVVAVDDTGTYQFDNIIVWLLPQLSIGDSRRIDTCQ
jgi:hypothetical protein